jgi:RNA polymerase sigma-70 factor (ECF subfamily)
VQADDHRAALTGARAGDRQTLDELVGPYWQAIYLHCYRIVGNAARAEDVAHDVVLAAQRGISAPEDHSDIQLWLYRIATTYAFNAVDGRADGIEHAASQWARRHPATAQLTEQFATWSGDVREDSSSPSLVKEIGAGSSELTSPGVMAALQCLQPRSRAALLLRDVIGFSDSEVAEIMEETSEKVVDELLDGARKGMETRLGRDDRAGQIVGPANQSAVAGRFVESFESGDVPSVVALLTDDVVLALPPWPTEYQGRDAVSHFLETVEFHGGMRRYKLRSIRADRHLAFGRYLVMDAAESWGRAHGIVLLGLRGTRICALTHYVDNALLESSGLPQVPLLVVAFGDDVAIPPRLSREVADTVPGARYVEIPDAGHFGYLERPDEVNRVLLDFLAVR